MLSRRIDPMRIVRYVFGACIALALLATSARAQTPQPSSHNGTSMVGQLTLEQCIDIALKQNPQVIIAERQVESSEATAYGSWSNVMPTMNASLGNFSRSIQGDRVFTQDVPVGSDPVTGDIIFERRQTTQAGRSLNNYSANFNLQQPIYNGGRSWNTIKQAKQNVENTRMGVDATRHLIVSNVKTQYYNLLKATRLRGVFQEQVKLSEEQLRRSDSMYEIGSVAKVDVLQARAQLGQAKINYANQETALFQAMASLNNAMGQDVNISINIVDPIQTETPALPPAPMSMEQATQTAMQNNPAVKRDLGNVSSSRINTRIAKGALWPTINGSLSYSRFNSAFDGVYGNLGKNWTVNLGLNISLSILNGTQTYANIQQAQAGYMIAEETLEQTRRNAILTIKQSLLTLETTRQIIELSSENIIAAEESMRLAEERYRVGSGTLLDVFTAQVTLIQGKANLVNAQYDYKIAEASLDQALGRR